MNIFVAKLSFKTTDETLRNIFENYGEVASAKVVMDREGGRSKGFGFVEMPNTDEANSAITGLNDTELDGRVIVVKEANPRTEKPKRFNQNSGNRNFNRSNDRGSYKRNE